MEAPKYKYAKISARNLVAESLESNGKLVFSWDSRTQTYDYSGLRNFGFSTLNINPEDRPISFLRYLANNSVLKEGSPVKLLMDFVEGMLWFRRCDDGNSFMGLLNSSEDIAAYFVQHGLVEDLERFLRSHDVDESVEAMDNPDGSKGLYFKHKQLLPVFSVISSGTSALAILFYWQQFFPKVSFLFIDEFDAFYHWAVAETILKDMIGFDKQCVMTTHNTNLLDNKTTRPDCCFVIDKNGLSSLANRTEREIRQGNNLERLYLAGEFNG